MTKKSHLGRIGSGLTFPILLIGGTAMADDLGGTIGSAPDATVSYEVTCFPNESGPTDYYWFQVEGMTANRPFILKATASKGGSSSMTTDPSNGNGSPGPGVTLKKGDGPYIVTLSKAVREGQSSTTGTMVYKLTSHCQAANGGHTGFSSGLIPTPTPPTPPGPTPPVTQGMPSFSGALNKKALQKVYQLECQPKKGEETAGYHFQVKAGPKKGPYGIQMVVSKEGYEDVVLTDADYADNAFTDFAMLEGGDGTYTLRLSKYADDPDTDFYQKKSTFKVKHYCESADGLRTKLKKLKKIQ